MKIWIIVLTIVFILLWITRTFIANYIRNDKTEMLKYHYLDGASTLGIWHGVIYILDMLVGVADLILIIITLADKLL